MDKIEIYDCFGAELNINDLIAFPRRCGSSLWMSYGKIIGISTYKDRYKNIERLMLQLEINVNQTKDWETNKIIRKSHTRKINFTDLNRCVKICK